MEENELNFDAFNEGESAAASATDGKEATTAASELETIFSEEADEGSSEKLLAESEDGVGDTDAGTKAQLARLRKQRHELRSENQTLKERVSSTEKALDSAKAIGDAITNRYQDRDNPAAAVGFDADFMDALERRAKSDPEIMKLAQVVRQEMEGKTFDAPTTPAVTEQAPVEDKRVTQLLNERKQEKLSGLVEGLGVKSSMIATVAKEVLSRVGDDFSKTDVKEAILAAGEDLGWSASDITNVKPKETKESPDGGKSRAAVTAVRKESDDSGKPKAAQSHDEWKKNRESIFQSLGDVS